MADFDILREDYAHWQDDGCEQSPSCLSCPLAACIYDLPVSERPKTKATLVREEQAKRERLAQYTEIVKLHSAGKPWDEIAVTLRVSKSAISKAIGTVPPPADIGKARQLSFAGWAA